MVHPGEMICLTLAESKCMLQAPSYLSTLPFPYGCDGRWRQARNVDLCCPLVLMLGTSQTLASFPVKGGGLALLKGLGLLCWCMPSVLSVETV